MDIFHARYRLEGTRILFIMNSAGCLGSVRSRIVFSDDGYFLFFSENRTVIPMGKNLIDKLQLFRFLLNRLAFRGIFDSNPVRLIFY